MDGDKKNYSDLVGSKDGIYRSLTNINNRPGLFSSSDEDIFYTLEATNGNVFIDCFYTTFRSKHSGVRVNKAVCGLGEKLTPEYTEIPYQYLNKWKESANRINIEPLRESNTPLKIETLIENGLKEINLYKSMSDLENSSPTVFIESPDGCYLESNNHIFLVYDSKKTDHPIKMQIVEDGDNMQIKDVDNAYITSLPRTECYR
jgi:hypothetical protein